MTMSVYSCITTGKRYPPEVSSPLSLNVILPLARNLALVIHPRAPTDYGYAGHISEDEISSDRMFC